MTDKDKLAKVRAEIERRYNYHKDHADDWEGTEHFWKADEDRELLSFTDSMQKESKECMYSKDNYTDEDRKVLCEGCEKKCKFNKKEEPVSEDLKEAYERYVDERMALLNPDVADMSCDRDTKMSFDVFDGSEVEAAFYEGANWQKQQMEAYRIEHCKSLTNEQAELEDNFVSSHVKKNNRIPTFIDAIEYGIEYGKQQMMANAIDTIVKVDAGGYPYVDRTIELYDYDREMPLAKKGDKVKVIVIKQE